MVFSYSRKNIIFLTLIITTIIFIAINAFIINNNEKIVNEINSNHIENIVLNENTVELSENINSKDISNSYNNDKWSLKIPKIDLYADIEEDTTQEVLKKFIGHFKQTSKWSGNIGLAAHNRGYEKNYFQNLKELEYGDEIEYCYNGNIKKYKVFNKEYIVNTDWSKLVRTKQNKITLITCMENQPQYRLCVQAVEI